MQSKVKILFEEWLTLMEKAYDSLTYYEFRELENRIRKEITHDRRARAERKEAGDAK